MRQRLRAGNVKGAVVFFALFASATASAANSTTSEKDEEEEEEDDDDDDDAAAAAAVPAGVKESPRSFGNTRVTVLSSLGARSNRCHLQRRGTPPAAPSAAMNSDATGVLSNA